MSVRDNDVVEIRGEEQRIDRVGSGSEHFSLEMNSGSHNVSAPAQTSLSELSSSTTRAAAIYKPKCAFEGCTKLASRKGKEPHHCIAHGGGRRCFEEGCNRTASRTGEKPNYCFLHGGGRRCSAEGCDKLAVSPTDRCKSHGGGKRCTVEGCTRAARWPHSTCISHGGGARCKTVGCEKLAKAKGGFCIAHSRNPIIQGPVSILGV